MELVPGSSEFKSTEDFFPSNIRFSVPPPGPLRPYKDIPVPIVLLVYLGITTARSEQWMEESLTHPEKASKTDYPDSKPDGMSHPGSMALQSFSLLPRPFPDSILSGGPNRRGGEFVPS